MKKGYSDKILIWLPVLIVMIFIFALSQQSADGSQELSDYFVIRIFDIVKISIPSVVIRKAAHIFEYFLLCIFTSNALRKCGDRKWYLSVLIFTFFYACSDEIHQMFIPGRAGRPSDVLIDMSGAVTGLLIYLLILRHRRNKHGKNQTV